MNDELRQYRFARIEAQNVTRARLEARFRDGVTDIEELERAIEEQLATEPNCTPWRLSEVEQAGSRDGMRLAALEFYWEYRRQRHSGSGSSADRVTSSDRSRASRSDG